jgi:hypothetical protein
MPASGLLLRKGQSLAPDVQKGAWRVPAILVVYFVGANANVAPAPSALCPVLVPVAPALLAK